jgi:steroid delta-isomerase-like uncharacterized protein
MAYRQRRTQPGDTDMTNKDVIRAFYDCFNQHNLDLAEPMIDPNILLHDPFIGESEGIDKFRELGGLFLSAFPDQHTTISQLIEEDGLVAALHTHKGTFLGDFLGVPPNGRPFVINGFELFRVSDGKITEFWRHDDEAGLLRQLGLMPEPAAAEG